MIPVKVKRLTPETITPEYKSEGAACFDLTITQIDWIDRKTCILKFGLAFEIPVGYKIVLVPRSSFTHKGWIQSNSPGQIDSDYRGEIQMRIEAIPERFFASGFHELAYPELPFKVGDRAAQCYIEKVIKASFEEVKELSSTERGIGAWGSTGK